MPGFDHGPSDKPEVEHEPTIVRNSRHGLRLFAIYFVFYAGFVAVNAFRPDWTEATPFAGLNVAVLYGFALIFGALLLAFIYGWLCQSPARDQWPGDSA